jgi:hypothetical protein
MCDRIYTFEEKMIIDNFKASNSHVCYYCKNQISKEEWITVDHKTPYSKGGSTTNENLVIACVKCNNEKDNMTEEEYCIYKEKQREIQNNFEVIKDIQDIINIQNNVINRIEKTRREFHTTNKQVEHIQQEIMYDNFNACEGYYYAKQMKELLSEKNELFCVKEQYNNLHIILGNHQKQLNELLKKVSTEVYNFYKPIIKKQIQSEFVNKNENIINIIDYKNVVNI